MSKDDIYNEYQIKPYKREGKAWLYKLEDIYNIGLEFDSSLNGFYPIPNFEEKFWINKEGKILNINAMYFVKTYIGADLYEHVILKYYGKNYRKRVHSIMGIVFLGKPKVVNHKDGVKSHNYLSNLERSTHSQSIKHAYENNHYTTRGSKGTSVIVINKKTGIDYIFSSLRKAESFTGVDRHRIKNIIIGKNINNTNWDFKFK